MSEKKHYAVITTIRVSVDVFTVNEEEAKKEGKFGLDPHIEEDWRGEGSIAVLSEEVTEVERLSKDGTMLYDEMTEEEKELEKKKK